MTPACIFCRIAAKESPADIEYEDDLVMAFRDLYPKAPVHLLIVPKRHIESIAQVEPGDAGVLGRCIQVARLMGERKIRHLPVLEGENLLGIVGIREVVRALVERLWRTQDDEVRERARELLDRKNAPVS